MLLSRLAVVKKPRYVLLPDGGHDRQEQRSRALARTGPGANAEAATS
jgi:hypothetical protein